MTGRTTAVLGLVLLGVSYSMSGHVVGHGGHGGIGGGYGGDVGHGGGYGGDVGHGGGYGGGVGIGGGGGGGDGGWGWSHPKYSYSYGVSDKSTWDQKTASEWRDGKNVKGHYSLREPDGSIRTVNYVSDGHGFRAQVHRTPLHHGHGGGHGGIGGGIGGGAGIGGGGH